MNTPIFKHVLASLSAILLLAPLAQAAPAVVRPLVRPLHSPLHLADYDSEPRRPDGRVDCEALVARLKELHVNIYYWLVWHAATDWDDLKLFLPKAAQANLQVWVYLVPPTESAPKYGTAYMEPFRLDYKRWAEEIAGLSLQHTNLTGWVIDDFYANHEFFTPEVIRDLQRRSKGLNPRLVFLPLMYFNEIRRPFVEAYREVIDGVVVAYPQDREEVEQAWGILNDAAVVLPGEMNFPASTPSQPGDFIQASQHIRLSPVGLRRISFREREDFTGPTAGYHFKQLLVNETVVWEEDVAGGTNAWQEITVEVPATVESRTNSTMAFRLLDKKGVSNFGVRWQLRDLRGEGLRGSVGLDRPQEWQVSQRGPFEAGFGDRLRAPEHRFHVPFIVMTAGDAGEFKQRHGVPGSPERMAEWLRFCLQAWRAGKCDGVVTYCLDKRPHSRVFDLARDLFGEFESRR